MEEIPRSSLGKEALLAELAKLKERMSIIDTELKQVRKERFLLWELYNALWKYIAISFDKATPGEIIQWNIQHDINKIVSPLEMMSWLKEE